MSDVLATLPRLNIPELAPPPYIPVDKRSRVFLAWHNFHLHMTDEGWQLQQGLEQSGYQLWGKGYDERGEVRVPVVIQQTNPGIVILQDKREWDPNNPACFDKRASWVNTEYLATLPDVFKITVLKDAHQQQAYHAQAAQEIGCHAWITYYNPDIICRLAPYVRRGHLIRTYHSIDATRVPDFTRFDRERALLSGALGAYYPLRTALARKAHKMGLFTLPHPGYHAKGTHTPHFLETLSHFKVAVCTASRLGYSLRKLIEATACGCSVITDLPEDEYVPAIDENLIRVNPKAPLHEIKEVIDREVENYSPQRQYDLAQMAKLYYDYRKVGERLGELIELKRITYANGI